MGRPLKPPEQRRNRTAPGRGEWVTLEHLTKSVLPRARPEWSVHAKRAWAAWRLDPVTSQWSRADVAFAMELCRQYDDLPPNEWRSRWESLGLTPKGRRDLRWRSPEEAKTHAEQPPPVKRLRVMDDAGKAA